MKVTSIDEHVFGQRLIRDAREEHENNNCAHVVCVSACVPTLMWSSEKTDHCWKACRMMASRLSRKLELQDTLAIF